MDDFGRLKRSNNFGALRLLFAVLVILSHSFELVDGNRSREILTRIFGTISFGQLGLDGFFLISGYLITKSYQKSRSSGEYLLKRILRIYPGYVVAYLICILAVGPFVGGQFSALLNPKLWLAIPLLHDPNMPGVFPGTPFQFLNAPMWTIGYEFRCYLLVLAAGVLGLLPQQFIMLVLTVCALALSAWNPNVLAQYFPSISKLVVFGNPDTSLWFAAIFGCGALYYLYDDRVRYDWRLAILAGLGLFALMFSPRVAETAVAVLGGYILFWFAFNVRSPRLAAIGGRIDLSYGIYLYAWPVQKMFTWLIPGISPWMVFVGTTAIVGLLALASWLLIEKPFLNLKAEFSPIVFEAAEGIERAKK